MPVLQPKANQLTKKVLLLHDTDLARHLLCMCPVKWQTQCDLTENTTPISTRALLLELENIENNTEMDYKAQIPTKMKGAEGKHKMESVNSCTPKNPRRWAGPTNMHPLQETWEAIQVPQYKRL